MTTALLVMAALGCAGYAKASFDSKAYPTNQVAINRLVILANLKNASMGDKMYRGLSEGLTKGFEACNVRSTILQVDPLDLDNGIDDAATAFNASATMAIVARGNEIVKAHALGFAEKLHFELAIFDAGSGNPIWLANSVLDLGTPSAFKDDTLSGSRFAASIVARIRGDGVLNDCK